MKFHPVGEEEELRKNPRMPTILHQSLAPQWLNSSLYYPVATASAESISRFSLRPEGQGSQRVQTLEESMFGRRNHYCDVLILVFFVALPGCTLLADSPPCKSLSPGIRVELDPKRPLSLRVTLQSASHNTETIERSRLPWAWRYAMVFVAVREHGQPLEMELPVEDPVTTKIVVHPGETLTGDINLNAVIRDVGEVNKQSNVHLFWAYESPKELDIPHWSGGWILIPQHKCASDLMFVS